MGAFIKEIGKMGAMGAATAAGGPAAGAAVAGGMGALGGLKRGGTLGDMLMGGAQSAGSAYLGGKLAPTVGANATGPVDVSPAIQPTYNMASNTFDNPSLLDALKFNINNRPY